MNKKDKNSRVKEIIAVFLKHGITKGTKILQNPEEIRIALEELGPTFVKIGQILSTRPDLLPEDFINEFKKLQDDVKPEKSDEIIRIIEDEFNDDIDNIFISFDREPMASASMAQVHKAIIKDGDEVVVKVQRPNIRERMLEDISILRSIAKITTLTFHDYAINLNDVIDELWDSANNELDFIKESNNVELFYQNNRDVNCIKVPKVFKEYTTSKVITMEYIDGIKISNCDELDDKGYDLEDIAKKLVQNYFKQVFEDGYFHGDPHPGNILINDRKIAYIDFGMMGYISKSMRTKFMQFISGIAMRDIWEMTESVIRIGIIKGKLDKNKLYGDISEIYSRYIDESLGDINIAEMMNEVFKVCKKNSIVMPKDMVMLLKAIMTLEGLLTIIAPSISVMDVVIPYIKSQIASQQDLKKGILDDAENMLIAYKNLLKIPSMINNLIKNLNSGKIKVQMEYADLEKIINDSNRIANRVIWGIVVAAMLISSALIVRAGFVPDIIGVSHLGFIGYALSGILGIWLLISIIKSGKI